jgi:hypothetical protein
MPERSESTLSASMARNALVQELDLQEMQDDADFEDAGGGPADDDEDLEDVEEEGDAAAVSSLSAEAVATIRARLDEALAIHDPVRKSQGRQEARKIQEKAKKLTTRNKQYNAFFHYCK